MKEAKSQSLAPSESANILSIANRQPQHMTSAFDLDSYDGKSTPVSSARTNLAKVPAANASANGVANPVALAKGGAGSSGDANIPDIRTQAKLLDDRIHDHEASSLKEALSDAKSALVDLHSQEESANSVSTGPSTPRRANPPLASSGSPGSAIGAASPAPASAGANKNGAGVIAGSKVNLDEAAASGSVVSLLCHALCLTQLAMG